jgi:hypothetical protein
MCISYTRKSPYAEGNCMTPESYARTAHDWDDYYHWSDSERHAYVESLEHAAEAVEKLGDWKGASFLRDLATRASRSRKVQPIWSDAQNRWLNTLLKKVQMSTPEGREKAQKEQDTRRLELERRKQEDVAREQLTPKVAERLNEFEAAITKLKARIQAYGYSLKRFNNDGSYSCRADFERKEDDLSWWIVIECRAKVDGKTIDSQFSIGGGIHYFVPFYPMEGQSKRKEFGERGNYFQPKEHHVPIESPLLPAMNSALENVLDEGEKAEDKVLEEMSKSVLEMIAGIGDKLPEAAQDIKRWESSAKRKLPISRDEAQKLKGYWFQADRMGRTAHRVVGRYLVKTAGPRVAFEYKEKPATKKSRIEKLLRAVGVSKEKAGDIADKIVSKHGDIKELARLAIQKSWPVTFEDGKIIAPGGELDLAAVGI